ncbi:uncharacterized protein LOC128858803 [Anastrepha ludens]|uniref:uncharacterized protein LOC128858803 n=1 Tax=Anastrepha ludens TaxID=28586 RepID=UPI0023AF710D|nr:uncharacterized protein LOC128858803 [Anastrepha ludens]XP_053951284.1 uncharacterized protein LOC128858803 [Anastrepha ludens]
MKCELCDSERCNTIEYGEFLTKNGKGVHTNCLYLSSGLRQAGRESEGFLGFLLKDIAAERARVSKIQCYYCGKMRANIGCCESRCHRSFHMICGIECGAMNQFLHTFRSFCNRHVRKVQARPKPDDKCCICYENIFNENERFRAVKMIRAPCCRNGWFHKICLQKFAKSAGYFFKCPLCNDLQKFRERMSSWGIFVQDKDAEWEMVPNAYAELLERPGVCGAKICNNADGRSQCNDLNPFLYCSTCGSVALHRRCVPQGRSKFECDNCKQVLKTDSGSESIRSKQQHSGEVNGHTKDGTEDENSDVDVCDDTDKEISCNNQEESDDEDIGRPNIKQRTALQITSAAEESTVDDVEDLVILGSSRRMPANKRDIIDQDSESDSDFSSCKDKQLSYSGDEADCSENEGLVDSFVQQQKTPNSRYHKTDIGDTNIISSRRTTRRIQMRSNKTTQSGEGVSALNVSCIGQRTRRRSTAMRLTPLNEEFTTDDVSSTNSYQSLKSTQVLQYDDEHNSNDETASINEERIPSIESTILSTTNCTQSDGDEKNHNDTNVDRGVLDYFYTLLREVKQSKSMDHLNTASAYDEEADIEVKGIVDMNVKERQGNNRSVRHKLDKKDTHKHFESNEANSLHINCIANRTRRRSWPNMESTQNQPLFVNHAEVAPDNTCTINSGSSSQSSQSQEVYVSEKSKVRDGLKSNCKADRTGRFCSEVNAMETINELDVDAEEQNTITDVSCIAKRTRKSFSLKRASHNGIVSDSSATDHTNYIAKTSNSTTSSTESFKYSTFFGRSFEYLNGSEASCKETAKRRKRLNTITDEVAAKQSAQLAQKRRSTFDTPKSSKIPALSDAESESENKNIFELSCIANRTRRMSADRKNGKQITAGSKNKEADNAQAAHITSKLFNDSPHHHKSNDIMTITSPSANSSASIVLSSGSKRGQRIRMRPRRFLYSDDDWDSVKSNVLDSPIPKMLSYSNIMEMNDAYIMPKYVRVNGKLKRVPTETLPQQQTLDAKTHFARSYNLLLHTTNDNHHTSTSST